MLGTRMHCAASRAVLTGSHVRGDLADDRTRRGWHGSSSTLDFAFVLAHDTGLQRYTLPPVGFPSSFFRAIQIHKLDARGIECIL